MRLRIFLAALLLASVGAVAMAGTVTYEGVTYIYPGDAGEARTLTIAVEGESFDPETFALVHEASLSGAVFGVYARDGRGQYVPLPDPKNPLAPLKITPVNGEATVSLPSRVDLYLRQEAVPDGYLADAAKPEYLPLTLPQAVTYTNRRDDMQGIQITLTGDGEAGETPLAGIAFQLEGAGETYRMETNEEGVATLFGIAPGAYTLTQIGAQEGYHIDEQAQQLTIAPNEPTRLMIRNSRAATLTLITQGLAADASRTPRVVPISRAYQVTGWDGTPYGTLENGQSLSLPATREGATYMVRLLGTPSDGFAQDTETYRVVLTSGESQTLQTIVRSEKGFFTFTHISTETGQPIAGGLFAVYDAQGAEVLTFAAGDDGHYSSEVPLPPGAYTIRMAQAAEGFQYAPEPALIEVVPYFSDGYPIAHTSFASMPIPEALLSPSVHGNVASLPSLFDADAEIDFTLTAFDQTPALAVTDIAYAFTLPDVPGLEVLERRENGARVRIRRRFPLAKAAEVERLVVTGTVSYTLSYPVDAQGQMRHDPVEASFEVPVATFDPAERSAADYGTTGYVFDGEDAPIPGMRVTLGEESVETDIFGAYAFVAAEGAATLQFHPEAGYGARTADGVTHILPLSTRLGRVETEGPIDGYPITLSIGGEGPFLPNADGTFTITGLFTQADALEVEAPDGVLVRIEAGETTVVRLYAQAGVEGEAISPEGAPVSGLGVVLEGMGTRLATQSDEAGRYSFSGLFPGAYTLTYDPGDALVLNGENTDAFSLEAGEMRGQAPVSAMAPAAIAGQLLDGSVPYAGVSILLMPKGMEAVTDAEGRFAFEGLGLGTYALEVQAQAEVVLLDMPEAIEIAASAQRASYTIHAVRPAALSGRIFGDDNDDGLYSPEEGGLAGAVLTLEDAKGAQLAEQVTAEDGDFRFGSLTPGAYRIRVRLPEGMLFAREASGTERLVAGVDAQETIAGPYVVGSGERLENLNAGAVQAGWIAGDLWADAQGDGVRTGHSAGVAGATVTLLRGDEAIATATTDDAGSYRFEQLRAGEYALRVALPEGMLFSANMEDMGATYAEDGAAELPVRLRRPSVTASVSMGVQREASVSAFVVFDRWANGDLSQAEGLAGIAVELYQQKGEQRERVRRMETDAAGAVSFEGLRPGTYLLRYALPDEGAWGFTAGVTDTASGHGYTEPFVLGDGAAWTAEQVALTQLGAIGGVTFVDENYNGLRDAEEPYVSLDVALLDEAGQVLAETVSALDGRYRFEGLPTGAYAVRFVLPEGYCFTQERPDAPSFNSDVPEAEGRVATTSVLYLPMGETLPIDAGAYRPASIAGGVWQDAADSGRYEEETSAPLAGVSVALLREGEVLAEATTDAGGGYAFDSLSPGAYALRVTLSPGQRFSLPAIGETTRRSWMPQTDAGTGLLEVALESGDTLAEIDFGVVITGEVAGRAISLQDGSGLPGVQVTLVRGDDALAEATTDGEGRYAFADIRPGDVQVAFAAPEGWTIAPEQANPISLEVLQGGRILDADVRCLPDASISGFLWIGEGGDGQADGADTPLVGVAVSLHEVVDGERVPVTSVRTDASGHFRFDKLLPGSYVLAFSPPDGTILYGGTETAVIPLQMGEDAERTASAYIASTLSGRVWEDTNTDGLRDADEPLLEGVLVSLVQGGVIAQQQATDEAGAYRFEDVAPGEYTVQFSLPEGYLFTRPKAGGSRIPETEERTASTLPATLSMGSQVTDLDAGALQHTRIGDLVWLDENGNGLQDTGEPGIEGIPIALWYLPPEGGAPVRTAETVSGPGGWYRFDAVRPGTYQVAFEMGEYLPTQQASGLEQINSKLPFEEAEALTTEPFTAQSGRHQLTIDAGLVTREIAYGMGWFIEEPFVETGDEAAVGTAAAGT